MQFYLLDVPILKMKKLITYFSNSIRGIIFFVIASFAFVGFMFLFSLFLNYFNDLKTVFWEEISIKYFYFAVYLLFISIPIGLYIGLYNNVCSSKKIFFISFSAIFFYWLVFQIIVLFFNSFQFSNKWVLNTTNTSLYGMLSYPIFILPFITILIFMIYKGIKK